jgi:site-specific DNA recombinase
MGINTSTGLERWDPTTIGIMLRTPSYYGTAMFGRNQSTPATQTSLRPIRGRSTMVRSVSSSKATPREEWIGIPVPAIIDKGLFDLVQAQLDENRRRKRDGRKRPGWLLQGLIGCKLCGYAFYGKMARGTVGGQKPADYGYYRCTGTDAHKFGGQAVCSNRSVRSDKLEAAVWQQVQIVLDDPDRIAAEHERRSLAFKDGKVREDVASFDRQIARLQQGIDRLID